MHRWMARGSAKERSGAPDSSSWPPGSRVTEASFERSAIGCPFSLCLCWVPPAERAMASSKARIPSGP